MDSSKFTQVQHGKTMSLLFLFAKDVFEQKIYESLCF